MGHDLKRRACVRLSLPLMIMPVGQVQAVPLWHLGKPARGCAGPASVTLTPGAGPGPAADRLIGLLRTEFRATSSSSSQLEAIVYPLTERLFILGRLATINIWRSI